MICLIRDYFKAPFKFLLVNKYYLKYAYLFDNNYHSVNRREMLLIKDRSMVKKGASFPQILLSLSRNVLSIICRCLHPEDLYSHVLSKFCGHCIAAV